MSRSGPVTKDTSTVALGLAQVRIGTSAANIATTTEVLTSDNSIGALANTKFASNVDYWKLESGFPLLEDLSLPLRESSSLECAFKELIPFNLALARGIDPLAAVDSSSTFIDSATAAGTTTGVITTDNLGGVVQDTFTIVFDSPTTFDCYGADKGLVGSAVDLTSVFEPDDGVNDYFSLPASFFSGTWAASETYTFKTTPYVVAAGGYTDVHTGTIGLGAMTSPAYMRMEAVYTFPNQTYKMVIIFPRANVTSSVEIDFQSEDNVNVPLTVEAKSAGSDVSGGDVAWDTMPLGVISFLAV